MAAVTISDRMTPLSPHAVANPELLKKEEGREHNVSAPASVIADAHSLITLYAF